MGNKNKEILLLQRLFIWISYFLAGFLLYSKKGYILNYFHTFAKIIYPLSIFWLQIRIKKKGQFLPIDKSMTTAQLWFNILPVLASLFTIVIVTLNMILYLADKLLNV